jgi:phosphatidylserine/phosphatidylglycerophosphate/cardiolipin synthase-like enzyme
MHRMRHQLIIIICFFICLNVQAAQEPVTIHAPITNVPTTAVETYLTPYDDVEGRFLQFLDQAKEKCYIASYGITNPNIIKKLLELHGRGVDVQVLTDKTQAAGKKEQIALAILEEDHIPVFAGRSVAHALMHCKFCVIDDHLVEDGSWNFTVSANKEDNILNFIDSKPRAKAFSAYWLKIQRDMK